MLGDILIIIGLFIGAVIVALVLLLPYFLWKISRIVKKIPEDMDKRIRQNKLAEQEVKHEREKRNLNYEIQRRDRNGEPIGDLKERVESLQVERTDGDRVGVQDSEVDDDGTDDETTELHKPDAL